jgi:hypothetical protein
VNWLALGFQLRDAPLGRFHQRVLRRRPRREVGHERVKDEPAMALASPNAGATALAASLKPKKHRGWR